MPVKITPKPYQPRHSVEGLPDWEWDILIDTPVQVALDEQVGTNRAKMSPIKSLIGRHADLN